MPSVVDNHASAVRHDASFRDPSGFVFEQQGRIFRAVDQPCLDLITELRDSGLLTELVEAGMIVETTLVDEPSSLVDWPADVTRAAGIFEHRRIDTISYPFEWSPAMLADAGILTLDLQMRLLADGYSLKDASAYNIQFVNGKPVFIDIPSIERPQRFDVWIGLGQFNRMFTLPLLLNRKKGQSLRSCFLANLDGARLDEVRLAFSWLELLGPSLLFDVTIPYWLGRRAESARDASSQSTTPKQGNVSAQLWNLRRLRSKLQRLARHRPRSDWTDYASTCSYAETSERSKVESVQQFLIERCPRRVLDVGCNTGRYALLASEVGAEVVAVDSDPCCIDVLYRKVKQRQLSILPLCMDIANPSPAIGFCNRERARFLDRIKPDCVLALASIHHLVVSANLPLPSIRDMFADLTTHHLVLEFVPTHDVMFRRLMRFRVDLYEDFTLDHCLRTFKERFHVVQRVPLPDSPRTLLFFEKK